MYTAVDALTMYIYILTLNAKLSYSHCASNWLFPWTYNYTSIGLALPWHYTVVYICLYLYSFQNYYYTYYGFIHAT